MSWSVVPPSQRRRLRSLVAARDAWTCKRPRCRCGGARLTSEPRQPLTLTVGHVVAVEDGGALTDPANLRAECAGGNYADGADRTNRKRMRATLSTSRDW